MDKPTQLNSCLFYLIGVSVWAACVRAGKMCLMEQVVLVLGWLVGHALAFIMLWGGKRGVDLHTWQHNFWTTEQPAEQQESSSPNSVSSKSGLDIPWQIFTQARWRPCRRLWGAKGSTDCSNKIQMSFCAWMKMGFTAACFRTDQQNRESHSSCFLISMKFCRVSGLGLSRTLHCCSTLPLFLPTYKSWVPATRSNVLQCKCLEATFTLPKKISTSPDIGIKSCRTEIQSV